MKKTLKTIIAVILAAAVIFCSFSLAVAADFSVGALTYTVSSDGYAVVADCNEGTIGAVNIPSTVSIGGKNYKVKYIGEKAFDSCYNISQIKIPEGVTAIRSHAFRDCVSLDDVYVPESLAICPYDAFDGCGNVTVHCYKSNYQFFTVYGMSANLEIDILDADKEDPDTEAEDESAGLGFIDRFINAIRTLIENILKYFNADDEEITFPFDEEITFPF